MVGKISSPSLAQTQNLGGLALLGAGLGLAGLGWAEVGWLLEMSWLEQEKAVSDRKNESPEGQQQNAISIYFFLEGSRVQGEGSRVQGLRFRVWGLGFRVCRRMAHRRKYLAIVRDLTIRCWTLNVEGTAFLLSHPQTYSF